MGYVPFEVKICGVCRPEDAALVAAAGADYLGVILAPGHRRSQGPAEAARIYEAAPGCMRVGVFVDEDPGRIRELATLLDLDVVQLHGSETAEQVMESGGGSWRIWKAIRPRDTGELIAGVEHYAGVSDAVLLDGWHSSQPGGSGSRLPWSELAAARQRLPRGLRLVLAGGLDPRNLERAVSFLRPSVVDVSSGVEGSTGWKDPALVREFVATARALNDRCRVVDTE